MGKKTDGHAAAARGAAAAVVALYTRMREMSRDARCAEEAAEILSQNGYNLAASFAHQAYQAKWREVLRLSERAGAEEQRMLDVDEAHGGISTTASSAHARNAMPLPVPRSEVNALVAKLKKQYPNK